MTALYNECDPFAAQWLRNLIAAGHIASGIVDERPIQEIEAFELSGFTQCHFFAGIGIWSHALRRAGWSDERPIWTGSCPCQPFSNAGTRKGISDERHLWPYWHPLIEQRKPSVVIGEQVASKDGLGWLDLVSTDMEASDYAFGASDLCAAGFDGAHIRQRLYFVGLGNPLRYGTEPIAGNSDFPENAIIPFDGHSSRASLAPRNSGAISGLADDDDARSQRREFGRDGSVEFPVRAASVVGGLANDERDGQHRSGSAGPGRRCEPSNSGIGNFSETTDAPMLGRTPVDWLYCRDEKWRPVEPGTFPLVDAAPTRVGRLRAYGNALDAETATKFCRTVKEICDGV